MQRIWKVLNGKLSASVGFECGIIRIHICRKKLMDGMFFFGDDGKMTSADGNIFVGILVC
jgi:hypothetical protein